MLASIAYEHNILYFEKKITLKKFQKMCWYFRGVHEKLKVFKCSQCDYASATKGNLDTHSRGVHHKIKAYDCDYYSYSATTKGNLYQHVKGVHGNKIKSTWRGTTISKCNPS